MYKCNELSEALPIAFGVPRGSSLGPLLFLVHINKPPAAIEHSKVSLYADDTVLYCFNAKEPQVECRSLQHSNVAKSEQTYFEPFKDQIHVNRKQKKISQCFLIASVYF